MDEFDDFDRTLRESLSTDEPPTADDAFERRLNARLDSRRPRAIASARFLAYSSFALTVCILAMALSGLDWRVGALSILLPTVGVIPLVRPWLKR